jgi:hypothetical protein
MSSRRRRLFRRICADFEEQQGNKSADFEILHNQLKRFTAPQHTVNVTAIEFCEVFVLDIVSFRKYVLTNERIIQRLSRTAQLRMELTLKTEKEFKMKLNAALGRESTMAPRAHSPI